MGNGRDYIACANCSRKIVPRLWHVTHFGVTRTQHICPFCGVVLYVTGPRGAAALAAGTLNALIRLVDVVGSMAGGRRRRRY